ncbi:hypothetical protein [Glaciibacter superstes]|uniref:hypothetical protein n=1 Tax=Glaciibacter superstes TaxID=501023 RepID=UPI0012FA4B00|nr:hypothetical protein [Glaciibacter superstes]
MATPARELLASMGLNEDHSLDKVTEHYGGKIAYGYPSSIDLETAGKLIAELSGSNTSEDITSVLSSHLPDSHCPSLHMQAGQPLEYVAGPAKIVVAVSPQPCWRLELSEVAPALTIEELELPVLEAVELVETLRALSPSTSIAAKNTFGG